MAVCVLAWLRANLEAVQLARFALTDERAEVRAGAARSLGEFHNRASVPKLNNAVSDNHVAVVLAAAHAPLLHQLSKKLGAAVRPANR